MFRFFKSKKIHEPLDPEIRRYFEHNILWLEGEFPEPPINKRKVFTSLETDFPIQWDASESSIKAVLEIIAEYMQINPENIEIEYFHNGVKELNLGGTSIFIETEAEDLEAAGLYDEIGQDKFRISLDSAILNNPEAIIATIAHELSHIKLLGEQRIDVNDEYLTDLTTVFFGFGIFCANTSFQYYQSAEKWGYRAQGYLSQEEWAYSLALFAFLREENNPDWSNHLNSTIKKDFERSLRYILDNEQEIFYFDSL